MGELGIEGGEPGVGSHNLPNPRPHRPNLTSPSTIDHRPKQPPETALLVMLHGAGSSGQAMADLMGQHAEEAGMVLLTPDSHGRTWDVIETGAMGRDAAAIGAAVDDACERHRVDHVVLGGFSDGASYALSLGLGDERFSHVVALSPGFMAPEELRGRPRIFVSHGIHDRVLPIDPCSRRLVPLLRRAGYDVEYVEFDGGHTVPPDVARAALAASDSPPRRR